MKGWKKIFLLTLLDALWAALAFLAVVGLLLTAGSSLARVYSLRDEALARAFPGAVEVKREDLFLSEDDVKRIEALSGAKVESRLFTYYKASGEGGLLGYAVIGSAVVRTKPAVYMVVVKPDGALATVEVLAFNEPEEYLPTGKWLGRFAGKRLTGSLKVGGDIQAVAGATMSARMITREVRKALAVLESKVMGAER